MLIIEPLPRSMSVPIRPGLTYPSAALIEAHFDLSEFESLLQRAAAGTLTIDGREIPIDERSRTFRNTWTYPSFLNPYSSHGGLLVQSDQAQRRPDLNAPLLSYEHRFVPTLETAIGWWSEIREFAGDRDTRIGTTLIYLPECRARLCELKWDDLDGDLGPVEVRVEFGAFLPGLRLKGSFRSVDGPTEPFDLAVANASATIKIPIPHGSRDLQLYLIGPDQTVYDFYTETSFFTTRDVSDRRPPAATEADVEQLVAMGEGPHAEFKEFVDPDKSKIGEIVRAVIAFANTSGGRILIGVNNACGVDGVTKALAGRNKKSGGRSMDDERDLYAGEIRSFVNDTLNRNPGVRYEYVQVRGCWVLVLTVPEGEQKPYSTLEGHRIYVRRGSNNVAAAEHELKQMFAPQRSRSIFGEPGESEGF